MESEAINPIETSIPTQRNAGLIDYLALARLNHSTKHIFIVPGFVFAFLLRGPQGNSLRIGILFGMLTAICVASANYVINEYLDRDFDRYHPTKYLRSSVQYKVSGLAVLFEWLVFLGIGLGAAHAASHTMLLIGCVFALQGIVYNVSPLRTKDRPYLDVLSESVNNPIRLLIGWAIVDPTTLPPSSIILSYWFGGAFLMAAKRYSEYLEIVESRGRDVLVRYRASFSGYTEVTLNASCFIYGLLSTFFLAVFLTKYRVEYLILVPAVIAFFGHYLVLATRVNSVAQNPENLFRDRTLLALIAAFVALFVLATSVDMPLLSIFSGQRYISLR